MITKKEVQYIAKLARLGLTEKEIVKHQKELSKILDYVEKLKEVDIDKVKPYSLAMELKNVARSDQVQKSKIWTGKLLDSAPQTKNGYLKVKSILKAKA